MEKMKKNWLKMNNMKIILVLVFLALIIIIGFVGGVIGDIVGGDDGVKDVDKAVTELKNSGNDIKIAQTWKRIDENIKSEVWKKISDDQKYRIFLGSDSKERTDLFKSLKRDQQVDAAKLYQKKLNRLASDYRLKISESASELKYVEEKEEGFKGLVLKDNNGKEYKIPIYNLPIDLKSVQFAEYTNPEYKGKSGVFYEDKNGNSFITGENFWLEQGMGGNLVVKTDNSDFIRYNGAIISPNKDPGAVVEIAKMENDEVGIQMWGKGHGTGKEGVEVQIGDRSFFPNPDGAMPEGDTRNYAFVSVKGDDVYGVLGNVVTKDIGLVIYNTNDGVVDFSGKYTAGENEEVISFVKESGTQYISGNAGGFASFKLPEGIKAEYRGGENAEFTLIGPDSENEWRVVRTGEEEGEVYAQRNPEEDVESESGRTYVGSSEQGGTCGPGGCGVKSGEKAFEFGGESQQEEGEEVEIISGETQTQAEPDKQESSQESINLNPLDKILKESDASKGKCGPGKGCSGGTCGPRGGCQ